jgi:hypothetical protein
MKLPVLLAAALTITLNATAADKDGWIPLFDGKSLDGWKANENTNTFKLEDGKIVVFGPRSHPFYVGPVQQHNFKNFHLKLEIMTFPKANSGVYFHTEWQDSGFPRAGFEVQVNNSHSDPKRGGGLYGIKDNYDAPAKDEEWYAMEVIVQGRTVTTKINGKSIIEWTEPEAAEPKADDTKKRAPARRLGSGTFALQGHDSGSKIYYRDISVKPLPEK